MAKTRTNEGAICYDHSLDVYVEMFSKIGSVFDTTKKGKPFYANESTALELFRNAWVAGNKELAFKLLIWCRDIRGGAGNRSGFRNCLKWLIETEPDWVQLNIGLIPEHGRWDDLRVLFGTPLDKYAAKLWGDAIFEKNVLAAKWAKREDKPLLKYLRNVKKAVKDIADFRRLLAKTRKEHIVEYQMCSNLWGEVKYPHVPSVAMKRYTNAFNTHDAERFAKFKVKVEKGEEKINASTLFPHDCALLTRQGDKQIADAQFNALPNYLEGTNQRIMTIVDSSGSMNSSVYGDVTRFDVSSALGLYCSDRLGKDNPFYRKFIQFCDESKLTDWNGKKFSDCYIGGHGYTHYYDGTGIFNGAIGSTRICTALDSILNFATMFKATNEQIPNVLLIISDMQFHEGSTEGEGTEVENCIKKWNNAGYDSPKIVYWNVAGYSGSPATVNNKNVGLVSGFSPSILKAVFSAEDFTPKGIMLKAIQKYKVVVPQ